MKVQSNRVLIPQQPGSSRAPHCMQRLSWLSRAMSPERRISVIGIRRPSMSGYGQECISHDTRRTATYRLGSIEWPAEPPMTRGGSEQ